MSKQVIDFIVLITTVLLFSSYCKASPASLPHKKCSMQDSVCLTEQAAVVIKPFVEGNTDLGIAKLDKIMIDLVEIRKNGLIYILKNLEVEGLKNAVIHNVSIDLNFKTIEVYFETSLTFNADYTADGLLFSSPVYGDGRTTVKMRDIKIEMLFFFDIVKDKDGDDIMNLIKPIYSYNVGEANYLFENAYNNDKEKSEKLHAMINRYWRLISSRYGDVYIGKVIDKIFIEVKHYLGSQKLKDLVTY